MKDEVFARKIVEGGRTDLRKFLEDMPGRYPRVGVPFSKAKMNRIRENIGIITAEGESKNIKVECATDGTNYVFFEYIFMDPK